MSKDVTKPAVDQPEHRLPARQQQQLNLFSQPLPAASVNSTLQREQAQAQIGSRL